MSECQNRYFICFLYKSQVMYAGVCFLSWTLYLASTNMSLSFHGPSLLSALCSLTDNVTWNSFTTGHYFSSNIQGFWVNRLVPHDINSVFANQPTVHSGGVSRWQMTGDTWHVTHLIIFSSSLFNFYFHQIYVIGVTICKFERFGLSCMRFFCCSDDSSDK